MAGQDSNIWFALQIPVFIKLDEVFMGDAFGVVATTSFPSYIYIYSGVRNAIRGRSACSSRCEYSIHIVSGAGMALLSSKKPWGSAGSCEKVRCTRGTWQEQTQTVCLQIVGSRRRGPR